MEISRVTSKGQVTIPKAFRELLKLNEGDRVAFLEEDGKVVIAKAGLIALREVQQVISQSADAQGITEEDLLKDLEKVREEMWNERK